MDVRDPVGMAGQPSPPSGTVTFLFTDIEGSTERWQADQSAMAEALASHDAALAELVGRHRGHVFKHTGDGICAVFVSPQDAVDAALAAHGALGLPVRIGLNTGEAEQRDGDYFGSAVNRCARVMDAGHGGQTLATSATVGLVERVSVSDLGEYRLKGLAASERIFQIGVGEFPPLRVRGADSLPKPRTTLVGRSELIEGTVESLQDCRLVTLIGPGGVGKTRVGIAAARRLLESFDRVVFVDLGVVGDEADVLPAVADALDVISPSLSAVTLSLSSSSTLVVLDNCEHVLDEAAELVEDLLDRADGLHVLATSREALAVEGEALRPVSALPGDGVDSPAVQLFVQRASVAAPDLSLGPRDLEIVQDLCRRLDRLPLAIELAAARVNVMSPSELLSRLDDRFEVLAGGRRGRRGRRRERHQTLRDAIDWSYGLLEPVEQAVLARLSTLGGEFDVAALVALSPELSEIDALDILGALADKSLLTVVRSGDQSRYRLLESIRDYSDERLRASGDYDTMMARLHEFLVGLYADALDSAWTSRCMETRQRILQHTPSLRRALDHALAAGDVGAASELIAPVARYGAFSTQGMHGWAGEVLAVTPPDHPSRQDLLAIQAVEHHYDGQWKTILEAGAAILDARPIEETPWWALFAAAFVNLTGGNPSEARRVAGLGVDAAPHAGPDELLVCRLLAELIELGTQRKARDPERIDEHITAAITHPSQLITCYGGWVQGQHARLTDDYPTMLSGARTILSVAPDDDATIVTGLLYEAWAHLGLGDIPAAVENADTLLEFAYRWGMPSEFLGSITIYALALQHSGDASTAAVMRGWLPGRFTFVFGDEIAALDEWLSEQLHTSELTRRHDQGQTSTPKDLRALTHEALQLTPPR